MYVFLLCGDARYHLPEGKNVIGRATIPVDEGIHFISIPSATMSISRMQAIIEVAPNADVWITDCESTNGTYIACNGGPGIRIEPKYYYQLKHTNRVVFGDVECTLLVVGDTAAPTDPTCATTASDHHHHRGITSTARPTSRLPRTALASDNGESDSESDSVGAQQPARVRQPYLSAEMMKRGRSEAESDDVPARGSSAKKVRTETTRASSSASNGAAPITVCFSGMDEAEKKTAVKLMARKKMKHATRILSSNLLVVGKPPTRTPKMIIAVARGIPVVTIDYLKQDTAGELDVESLSKYVPHVAHEKLDYPPALLVETIVGSQKKNVPALSGLFFDLSALTKKTKPVAKEIIEGCGGTILAARAKQSNSIKLTDADLGDIYDSLMRGKPITP